MKRMTPEELKSAFEALADEKYPSIVFRSSERIRQHLVAVEAEVAQAWERALEEAAERCDAMANMADGHSPVSASADRACADAIRALKSKPALEPCRCEFPEAGECRIPEHITSKGPVSPVMPSDEFHRAVLEMASEENGLLPKRRRREHEYGDEERVTFGGFIAPCVRPGCQASRLKSRDRTWTGFRQSVEDATTEQPGPCEVSP